MRVKKEVITKQESDPIGTIGESEEGKSTGTTGTKSAGIVNQGESGTGGDTQEDKGSGDESSSVQEENSQEEVTETPEEAKLRIKRANDAEAKRIKRAALKENGGVISAHIDAVPNTPSSKAKKVAADKAAKSPKASTMTADFLAKQLFGMHQLATLFVGPEAAITKEEANLLGEAAFEVVKEYDLAWIGKFGKWGGLITAVAIVEVPVIMRLRQKSAISRSTPMMHTVQDFGEGSTLAHDAITGIATGNPS